MVFFTINNLLFRSWYFTKLNTRQRLFTRLFLLVASPARAGLKCESAKMTSSKMRKKMQNIFRILDIVILAILHLCIAALVDLRRFFCGHCPQWGGKAPMQTSSSTLHQCLNVPHGLITELPLCYSTDYSVSSTDNLTRLTYK